MERIVCPLRAANASSNRPWAAARRSDVARRGPGGELAGAEREGEGECEERGRGGSAWENVRDGEGGTSPGIMR